MFLGNRRSDSGTTLVPVVLLMALAMLITTIIGQQLFYSITLTSQNQAITKAQAAAEGAIDVAKVNISTGACSSSSFNGSFGDETYTGAIEVLQKSGTSWLSSCPNMNTSKVRITTNGSAKNALGSGNTLFRSAKVQEVFDYKIVTSYLSSTVAAGSALQTYSGEAMPNTISPAPGVSQQQVVLSSGSELCEGTKDIYADVYVLSGAAELESGCVIHGNLWAVGPINLGGGTQVTGNIWGGSTIYIGNNSSAGNIYSTSTLTLLGTAKSVYAGGSTYLTRSIISGVVTSNLDAVTSFGYMEIPSPAQIAGRISLYDPQPCASNCFSIYKTNGKTFYPASSAATATAMQMDVGSPYAVSFRSVAGTVPFPPPPVAGWTSVSFKLAQWQSTGFVDTNQLTSTCVLNTAENTNIAGKTAPYLYDALSKASGTCLSAGVTGSLNVSLSTDIAIVANKITLANLNVTSADTLPHNVWLIVPDGPNGGANGAPDCSAPRGGITVSANVSISQDITVFAYTPCEVRMPPQSIWRGQIYAGTMFENSHPSQIVYNTVGIPGYDLTNGIQVPVSTYTRSMQLSMKRNLK